MGHRPKRHIRSSRLESEPCRKPFQVGVCHNAHQLAAAPAASRDRASRGGAVWNDTKARRGVAALVNRTIRPCQTRGKTSPGLRFRPDLLGWPAGLPQNRGPPAGAYRPGSGRRCRESGGVPDHIPAAASRLDRHRRLAGAAPIVPLLSQLSITGPCCRGVGPIAHDCSVVVASTAPFSCPRASGAATQPPAAGDRRRSDRRYVEAPW